MSKKYITPSKSGYTFSVVDDIGNIQSDIYTEIESASVGGVESIFKTKACIACNGNVDSINQAIGRCTKCNMSQKLDRCAFHLSAKLLIIYNDTTQIILTAFLGVMQNIAVDFTIGHDTDTADIEFKLLLADTFSLKYNHSHIIQSVTRH